MFDLGLDFDSFEKLVRDLTEITFNGYASEDERKSRGETHQLDHITPIWEAYDLGWTVKQTAARSNLQLITKDKHAQKTLVEAMLRNRRKNKR